MLVSADRSPLLHGCCLIVAFLCAAFVWGVRASAAAELPATDDRWSLVRSPNFAFYSNQGDHETRALLHDLEILRAVFVERFHFVERAGVEVTGYAFASRRDFNAYAPSRDKKSKQANLGGFYLPYPDRAVIVLAPSEDRDQGRRTIFHEYVHHLFRSAEQNPPVWFNEGTAELLAGISINGDKVEIGHPQAGRIIDLRHEKLLALETVFSATHDSQVYRSDAHAGVFYAQSWALLHYWYCGQSDIPRQAVDRFITGVTGDVPLSALQVRVLFTDCFGMDYVAMNRRLESYMTSGKYRYSTQPTPVVPEADTYATTAVSAEEIRVRLGELAYRVNRSPAGEAVVREAVMKRPQDPLPLELLGAISATDGETEAAAGYWERAIAAGAQNPAVLRELALIESRTWFEDFNINLRLPLDVSRRLRTRLLRSIQREPLQSPAYEMLTWVEAFAEDRSKANVNLVQERFPTLTKRDRTLVALAMVRLRLGANDAALKLLKSLPSLQPDTWSLQAAEEIAATIENRPIQRLGDPTRGVEVRSETGPVVRSTRRLPAVPLPDDL